MPDRMFNLIDNVRLEGPLPSQVQTIIGQEHDSGGWQGRTRHTMCVMVERAGAISYFVSSIHT